MLLGNSGVGKSSVAQAGVLAALVRQALPETASNAGPWPPLFQNSRQWCFLTLRPGAEPIKALIEAFLEVWRFEAGDPARIRQRNEWVELLLHNDRKTNLSELLDETERRQKELTQAMPPGFFLYIDQGEELYARAEPQQRRRFSEIISQGLRDSRLRALMSIRSDFLGALQGDEPLFDVRRQIDVPPLRESQLYEVVGRPASVLLARFETVTLADDIARSTAEESTKDAGALPLLSYVLDEMWTQMVERGDGMLRLPAAAIELGRVLTERADVFLASHPKSEDTLRRVLTLKVATVREDGQPTRRRAPALGVHGRGMAAGLRACRSSQSAPGDGDPGGGARPMPRLHTRRSSGAGKRCENGSGQSESSSCGGRVSRRIAAAGPARPSISRTIRC